MEINFIPVESRPKRPSRAPYLAAAMLYIFATLFFGTKVGMIKKTNQELESDKKLLATLNTNLSRYVGANTKLENMTSEANYLMKKIGVLKDIKKNKIPFELILREIGNLTPEGVWFEEFSIESPSEELHLVGFGTQPAEEKAFKFVYNLEGSETLKRFFNEIKLVSCNPAPGRKNQRILVITMVFRK